jgi:endonuclease/exonuclease/phosphatase family metal-dependent hydrolase
MPAFEETSRGFPPRPSRVVGLLLLTIFASTFLYWFLGRATADGRRLAIRQNPDATSLSDADHRGSSGEAAIRVLAWNIAHGRGDIEPGLFRNWRGGTLEERLERLERMAAVLRQADADVVVLNEVDFDARWSGRVNQAAFLARAAGYSTWVEQRSFDFQFPFQHYAFGNAILTRLPLLDARWVELPGHSQLEEAGFGSKEAVVANLATTRAPVSVAAIHLEFRSEEIRLAAVPVLDGLRDTDVGPLVLAGDFNTAPPGWPGAADTTALGELLGRGWRSPRAERSPTAADFTFPTFELQMSLDWILVEPPLRAVETRVLQNGRRLSDHAPVLTVVDLPGPALFPHDR